MSYKYRRDKFKWYLRSTSKVLKHTQYKGGNMGKYNIGDRFEIEVSEIINDTVAHIGPYYKIKGFDSFVIDENGLDRLKEVKEKENTIDWSTVKVDTPILVRDGKSDQWINRYFARYEDGIVYAWNSGATSWSIEFEDDVFGWNFAKLAEVENE